MKGTKVIIATIKLPVNKLYKYVDKIFNSVWLATKLTNNCTLKDTALAKYEINSINTNKDTRAKGVLARIKKEKNLILCIDKAKIVTPIRKTKSAP